MRPTTLSLLALAGVLSPIGPTMATDVDVSAAPAAEARNLVLPGFSILPGTGPAASAFVNSLKNDHKLDLGVLTGTDIPSIPLAPPTPGAKRNVGAGAGAAASALLSPFGEVEKALLGVEQGTTESLSPLLEVTKVDQILEKAPTENADVVAQAISPGRRSQGEERRKRMERRREGSRRA